MRNYVFAAMVCGALLSVTTTARAEDTTTTTTTTTTQPAQGVTVGVPGVVGVTIGGSPAAQGCTTRNTTHTNDATGDSVSRTSTDCN